MLALFVTAALMQVPTAWKDLIRDFHDLGLPEPPSDAVVLYRHSGSGATNDDKYEDFEFAIATKVPSGRWKRLDRPGEIDLGDGEFAWRILPPANDALVALKKEATRRGGRIGSLTAGPLFSIQATILARGDLAQTVQPNPSSSWRRQPDDDLADDRRRQLAYYAWQHWCRAFAEEPGDRQPIIARLEGLLDPRWRIAEAARRTVLGDMRATLEARPVPSDSYHAAIERLLELRVEILPTRQRTRGGERLCRGEDYPILDERCHAITRAGLDIVPALVDHLDDFRVTRSCPVEAEGPFGVRNVRIADVVAGLLWSMAPDEDFAYEIRDNEGRGFVVDRNHVLDWLRRAKARGERNFCLTSVFNESDQWRPFRFEHLRVLADKYPDDFRQVLPRILKRSDRDDLIWQTFEIMRDSRRPTPEKAALLKELTRAKDSLVRAEALIALVRVDRGAGLPEFVAAFDGLDDGVADLVLHRLAFTVADLNDAGLWLALERTAVRLSARRRVVILLAIGVRGPNPTAVPFWAKFLDDGDRAEYRGPRNENPMVLYVIRNIAAQKIARAWGWGTPTPTMDEGWAELRSNIKAELERRRGEAK